jgi:hypothetical protein
MTDLEATRLCFEAMGLRQDHTTLRPAYFDSGLGDWGSVVDYDPLNNDAQAMALVKRFNVHCIRKDGQWWASPEGGYFTNGQLQDDLNRAIVYTVAAQEMSRSSNRAPSE